jgi:hypothetical protein
MFAFREIKYLGNLIYLTKNKGKSRLYETLPGGIAYGYFSKVISCSTYVTLYIILVASNNSIQLFIIYVPSQQLQGQLQTQHSVDAIIIIILE